MSEMRRLTANQAMRCIVSGSSLRSRRQATGRRTQTASASDEPLGASDTRPAAPDVEEAVSECGDLSRAIGAPFSRREEGRGVVVDLTDAWIASQAAHMAGVAQSMMQSGAPSMIATPAHYRGELERWRLNTALVQHGHSSRCSLFDVLGMRDIGKQLFLKVRMLDRGPFARVCHEWSQFAREFWNVDKYELTDVHDFRLLRYFVGGGVTRVFAWSKPRPPPPDFYFYVLALGAHRLERLMVERTMQPGCLVDTTQTVDVTVLIDVGERQHDHEEAPLPGVSSFAVTKTKKFCIVILHGRVIMVRISRRHVQPAETAHYDPLFPKPASALALDPCNNNVIVFGVVSVSVEYDGHDERVPPQGECVHSLQVVKMPTSGALVVTTLQTLATNHLHPIRWLEYSLRPGAPYQQLLSCSSDYVALWSRDDVDADTIEAVPQCELRLPQGVDVRLVMPHPAWECVLFATNEALEVRRIPGPQDNVDESNAFGLRWRAEGLQVTAAVFVAKGNMLAVSDRGDRLLLLSFHGLVPAKRLHLLWRSVLAPHDGGEGVGRENGGEDGAPAQLGDVRIVVTIAECPDPPPSILSVSTPLTRLAVGSSLGEVITLAV